ncbi:ribonuclease D [Coralloluteibacterium stylophorae]|uniref:Ribonuclease D n=1 Tax=Coralloluteibacterium stylophorae TaxID=1776034 RepID=A0A8J7VXT7_9GAMM|nr:ribonuclease D [Coralloluteibacterium stylophorae]
MHHWIDRPELLQDRLADWQGRGPVALDTEFVRERTWYPQLALVQLALDGEILLVDPLVPGMTGVLRDWLADTRAAKLMHSASEDLQALAHACGVPPRPLFDTQIAAAMTGFGAGLGYQKLVETITGTVLAKGETRSDWLRRPLSASQQDYASDDVRYLHALHAELAQRLDALGRRDWLEQDCGRLVAQAEQDEPERWPHLAVRSAQVLDVEAQRRLYRLLRWREVQARALDRPKNWILDAELAVTLARRAPADAAALAAILDAHPKAPRRQRAELLQALATPLADEQSELPRARAPGDRERARMRALQDAVAAEARRLDLPEGLLASRRLLQKLLDGRGWTGALAGWRRQALEPRLAPLLEAP